MTFLEEPGESSGAAADTGTAVHCGIKAFHDGDSPSQCLQRMQDCKAQDFPLAAMEEAAAMFLSYATDRRNIEAEVVLCEQEITYEIAAAETDPTGAPIVIEGTVDQVRRERGKLKLWDAKSSKLNPDLVRIAAGMQAAGYCIGATFKLGETVHPGGVIALRQYKSGTDNQQAPVFRHFSWEFEDIEQILLPLRLAVANIRAGRLYHIPTEGGCMFCRMKSPDLCVPKLKRTKKALALL